jgi:tetratricopeptide (TPR) repeat protein
LKHAWEERPQYGVAAGLLAQIYYRQGRYTEAEAAARFSLERDSADALQHHTLSMALQAQERLREAVDSRRAAIRHGEPEHPGQWLWLAEIQMEIGDTAQAWATLDSARLKAVSRRERRLLDSILVAMGIGSR